MSPNESNVFYHREDSATIRVLVADERPLIPSGLKQILAGEPDIAIRGEAEDSEQVLQRIDQEGWDVVALDISMPGSGGLDALREIRRRQLSLPVLVLSLHSGEQLAVRAIKAGASGYLSETDPPTEIVQAIRKVASGKKYLSANLAHSLANAFASGSERPLHEALSDREFQVMCKIASGMTVSQIAVEASLSVKTVSTYRARMLEKMGMRTNAELTRYAIQDGLVE